MIDLKWNDLRNLNQIIRAASKLLSEGKGPGSYVYISEMVKHSGKERYKKCKYDDQLSRICLEHHLCAQLPPVVSGLARFHEEKMNDAIRDLERELKQLNPESKVQKRAIKMINNRIKNKQKYWSERIVEIEDLEKAVRGHVAFLEKREVAA